MTEILARAVGVSRRYGPTVALDRVDLDVPAGSMIGLLGPNGAGKSTLLNLLVGLRRPTVGRVELFGGSPQDAARRRGLGLTPQRTGLPDTLRVGEVLDFVARHYPDPAPTVEVLERFGLTGLARRQTGSSAGSSSRWPSSGGPGWWCSTSRPPAWTSRLASPCGRRAGAGRRLAGRDPRAGDAAGVPSPPRYIGRYGVPRRIAPTSRTVPSGVHSAQRSPPGAALAWSHLLTKVFGPGHR